MADYFTHFSAVIPMSRAITEEVIDLLEQAGQWDDEGRVSGPLSEVFTDGYVGFGHEMDDEGLWVYDEGSGDPQHVADLVTHLIAAGILHLEAPFRMEWANTCSKPRLDAFGGGVVVVWPDGTQHWMNTSDWGWEKEKEWKTNSG